MSQALKNVLEHDFSPVLDSPTKHNSVFINIWLYIYNYTLGHMLVKYSSGCKFTSLTIHLASGQKC